MINCTVIHICTHTQPCYGPFSGTTRVSWHQKKSSELYGGREDNRGRHTDHPAGRHSIQTNQRPTSIIPRPRSPHFCMLDALLSQMSLYFGLGQAPNMLASITRGAVVIHICNWLHFNGCFSGKFG